MQLTSLSLALTRAGFLSFSPASLFAAGEPGVWYEPSLTNGTCFQDSSGTTPVTAVEQPVGLILDKSKGLVLGPELLTNGDFSQGATGWTVDNADATHIITISGGVCRFQSDTTSPQLILRQTYSISAGKTYLVTLDVVSYTSGSIRVEVGGIIGSVSTGTGSKRFLITAGSSYSQFVITRNGANVDLTIDNISVRELPGNHATQTTSTSRPVLSARVNLLTKTELFNDTSGWPKTIAGTGTTPVVTDAYIGATAPDGTLTASRLQASISGATSGDISGLQRGSGSTVSTLSGSLWVKSNTSSTQTAWFRAGGAERSISVTTSWTQITDTGTTDYFSIGLRGAISGAGTLDILIWHPIQVPANQAALPYQRVNTATDYDTTGFPLYLKFDGVDDFLVTNSINFTATDKMTVFAGVRKLSNAAAGVLAETSASFSSNAGSFVITAPENVTGTYNTASRGDAVSASTQAATTGDVGAPDSAVITATHDIPGDLSTIRRNGVEGTSGTANKGAGNFLAYPLYIGRRGGTTLPFNGHLYSLIVRGAQSSAGQIGNTETWVAGKTGITL